MGKKMHSKQKVKNVNMVVYDLRMDEMMPVKPASMMLRPLAVPG